MDKAEQRQRLWDFIEKHAVEALEITDSEEREDFLRQLRDNVYGDALEAGFKPPAADDFANTFLEATREQMVKFRNR